jgi:hypothetical protein
VATDKTKRKRAPGGGRKPRGEFVGMTDALTIRMPRDVRRGVGREAERSGRSLSQEIARRLKDSLGLRDRIEREFGPKHIYALGRLVGQMAKAIEVSTGKRWHEDAFTASALCRAIETLVFSVASAGPVKVPERIEQQAKNLEETTPSLAVFSEQLRTPAGIGVGVANGAMHMLLTYETPPSDHPANIQYADQFYSMPELREALGLKRDAMKARKPKARK